MGRNDTVSIKKLDPVNQYFQGDMPWTKCVQYKIGMCLAPLNYSHDIVFIDDSSTTDNSPQIENQYLSPRLAGLCFRGTDHPRHYEMSL